MSVAISGVGVIKWLLELCWWEISYWWGWCDQMVMGSVLVGVQLLEGLKCSNIYGRCVGESVAIVVSCLIK